MEIPKDRRVRKTKKLLENALAELLSEKPLKSITVREIAERADINRGTFYLHYKDVYDMAEKIQNEIFGKFYEIISDYKPHTESGLFPMLVKLYELLSENAALAKCLLGENGDVSFIHRMEETLRETCLPDARKVLNTKDSDAFMYYYHFIVSGSLGLCSAWLSGDMKESPEEIARLTERFIVSGLSALQ